MTSNYKYTIEYTTLAEQDRTNIFYYIKEKLKSPKAAENQIINIYNAVVKLEDFPKSCEILTFKKFKNKCYRKLVVDNYLIFYTIDEQAKKVLVLRILYGRQKYQAIL